MEGWLLVSCSCSSSSAKEVTKELSAEEDTVLMQEEGEEEGKRKEHAGCSGLQGRIYLYMCRSSGPSRLQEDCGEGAEPELRAPC